MGQDHSFCSSCCHNKDLEITRDPLHFGGAAAPEAAMTPPSRCSHSPVPGRQWGGRRSELGRRDGPKLESQSPTAARAAQHTFTVQLHSAHIEHSVAKVGWMDPYAVIAVDDREVGRTKPDKWAHKEPKWDSSFTWSSAGVPSAVQVAIWDKNRFHEDKLCGSVTVPCSADMGTLERKEFTITKKNQPRGHITVTLAVKLDVGEGQHPDNRLLTEPTPPASPASLGAELDHMMTWSHSREDPNNSGRPSTRMRLAECPPEDPKSAVEEEDEEAEAEKAEAEKPLTEAAPEQAAPQAATPGRVQSGAGGGKLAPALLGSWKCTATRGLDEFLKATGVGIFQRKIAKAAKWPGWEFASTGEMVTFINHSAIGDLTEEFPLGKEYSWKDGQGNLMKCRAEWETTADGGILRTTRKGDIGNYSEERWVKGNVLEFTLTHGTGVSWGRTFQRNP